jgi:hypothetical protein
MAFNTVTDTFIFPESVKKDSLIEVIIKLGGKEITSYSKMADQVPVGDGKLQAKIIISEK